MVRAIPINILLIEDNEGDVLLTKQLFSKSQIHNQLWVARDGEEGLDFLNQRGKFTTVPRPDLILLDLNMPKMDGKEVLAAIKKDASLSSIPVVILTTSSAKQDVIESYQLNANCYIVKPVDFVQFIKIIQTIENFWFPVVKLPSQV